MSLEYSRYQKEIFDAITHTAQNIFVEAVAGSGKTFCLVEAAKFIPTESTILYVAYNAHIREALLKRVPPSKTRRVLTLHKLGGDIAMRYAKARSKQGNYPPKGYPYFKSDSIIRQLEDEDFSPFMDDFFGLISRIASLACAHGIVPGKTENKWGIPDTYEAWVNIIEEDNKFDRVADIADDHKTEWDVVCQELVRCAREFILRDIKDLDNISFDDMVYLPMVYNLTMPKFDWIFVDEVQDLSLMNMELISRCAGPQTRIVGCGDPKQSLYSFRLADPEAVGRFKRKFDCTTYPLPICYRCPSSVVAVARQYNKNIQPWEHSTKGSVIYEQEEFNVDRIASEGAIICRYNAPLIEVVSRFVRKGRSFSIIGRKDFAAALTGVIESLIEGNYQTPCSSLTYRLKQWFNKRMSYLLKYEHKTEISALNDKYKCLCSLIDIVGGGRCADDLIEFIQGIFTTPEEKRGFRLSSVHRIKGLEYDNIYFLDYDIQLQESDYLGSDATEKNILYVGVTRAQKTLTMIRTSQKFRDEFYQSPAAGMIDAIPSLLRSGRIKL